jgi:hypothetical protein
MRRIFGPKREKVAGDWIRLHNEELRNLYATSNIIRVIKSRRMSEKGLPLRSKYSAQNPILKHTQLYSSLSLRDQISYLYETTGKIIL